MTLSTSQRHTVGSAVDRFVTLGLRDDVLLLAIALELEVAEHPGEGKWIRAAARVYGRTSTSDGPRYWLERVIRSDLPRHIPAHEQPDGPTLTCIAPMVRRDACGKEVPLGPYSTRAGRAIPVLVGEHVTWHAYCRKHDHTTHPQQPRWQVARRGAPEAYAAVKRLRHNTGGQLRDAFPRYHIEEGYKWADPRWEPDDRPVDAVRLRLVPPLEPAGEPT